jgi:hypothetical protein
MYSLIRKLFLLSIVLVIVGFAARNYVVQYGLQYLIGDAIGGTVRVDAADLAEFYPPVVRAYDIKLRSGEDFHRLPLATVRRLEACFDQGLSEGRAPALDKMTLEIDEISIVRGPTGELNITALPKLKALASNMAEGNGAERQKKRPFIGKLTLSIHEASYRNYRGLTFIDEVKPMAGPVGLVEATFENIATPEVLRQVIVRETLRRFHPADLKVEAEREK